MAILNGFFTDSQQDAWLNQLFKRTSYTPPATLYIGLSTKGTYRDGIIAEPTGGGYARMAVTAASWSTSSGGVVTNTQGITFPAATATWGTISSMFLADAATGGNIIAMASLNPTTVNAGNTPSFAAGALRIARS